MGFSPAKAHGLGNEVQTYLPCGMWDLSSPIKPLHLHGRLILNQWTTREGPPLCFLCSVPCDQQKSSLIACLIVGACPDNPLRDRCPFHYKPQKAVFVITAVYRHCQGVLVVKNLTINAGDVRGVDLILGRGDPLEEDLATHSPFLPGESHGQRSLAGYRAEGCKESDMTEGT